MKRFPRFFIHRVKRPCLIAAAARKAPVNGEKQLKQQRPDDILVSFFFSLHSFSSPSAYVRLRPVHAGKCDEVLIFRKRKKPIMAALQQWFYEIVREINQDAFELLNFRA